MIADGHGSHIRADFIAHCMENAIDLLIMPPHCSHLLQPLDVGVFAAFKRAHSGETDAVSRLSTQRIQRTEWMEMFQRARAQAITASNIQAGWRGAGLVPSDPTKVLNRLPTKPLPAKRPRHTPPDQMGLHDALLKSSPPEDTELHQSNVKFTSALRYINDMPLPVRRYAERITAICETQNATIALMAQQLAEKDALLQARKSHKRGKRVKLNGVAVYSTKKVLEVAREEEAKKQTAGPKQPHDRPRKRSIEEIEEEY